MSGKYQWSCWVDNGTRRYKCTAIMARKYTLTFILLDNFYNIKKRTSLSNSCHEGNYSLFCFILSWNATSHNKFHFHFLLLFVLLFPSLSTFLYFYRIFISGLLFHSLSPLWQHFSQQQLLHWPSSSMCPGTDKGGYGCALRRNMVWSRHQSKFPLRGTVGW